MLFVAPAGCNGDGTKTAPQQVLKNYLRIEGFITSTTGNYDAQDSFGTLAVTNVPLHGQITLMPQSSIRIEVPVEYQVPDVLLEIQLNYQEGGEANFDLLDDKLAVIASGNLDNDGYDGHQTYTLLVDLTPFVGSAFVDLVNTSQEYDLQVNGFISLHKIEAMNNDGVFIADIRETSSRVDLSESDAAVDDWYETVGPPDDFWYDGEVRFDISDVISTMSRPVVEFNMGRDYGEYFYLPLYDDMDTLVGELVVDYDSDELMGSTFIVDLTDYKNSSYFTIGDSYYFYLSPFIKIYDADDRGNTAVLLDVTPGGQAYVSHMGKFKFCMDTDDYGVDGMYDDNVGYEAPHWLADPTHPTYGQDGTLEFSLPPEVATYDNPVLEICHFAPDSETFLADDETPGDPGDYPIEFYLYDQGDAEIAHVRFDEWEDDQGGMLKNQIPLGHFKTATSLKIHVPADQSRWSQMALPGFVKIFDSHITR
ncbi:MAG: hypothetical protein ACYSUN_02345 [Planctomycetota bacterium]